MKVGDKVKVVKSGTIFEIVRMGFSDDVALMSDSMLFTCSVTRVKDYKNITEAEFSELCRDKCTNLDGSELFPKETYQYGDLFEITEYDSENCVGDLLMLSQVGAGKFCLISYTGFCKGNRWANPIDVASVFGITMDEVMEMTGSAKSRIALKKVENV